MLATLSLSHTLSVYLTVETLITVAIRSLNPGSGNPWIMRYTPISTVQATAHSPRSPVVRNSNGATRLTLVTARPWQPRSNWSPLRENCSRFAPFENSKSADSLPLNSRGSREEWRRTILKILQDVRLIPGRLILDLTRGLSLF